MKRLEAVARSRPVRIALIATLAAFGAWSFAPYVVNDVSTQAAVNAPLIRLTAAVDGTVPALPKAGSYYATPIELRTVIPSTDAGEVAQLRAEAELAQARYELAQRQLAELAREEARLSRRAKVFAAATAERLDADIDTVNSATSACTAERAERAAALVRAEKLIATGFMSSAALDRARSAAIVAQSNCEAQRARLAALQATRSAAREGVYLGDSYNDAPYAEQQRDRLLLQRQQIETVAADAAAQRHEALLRLAGADERTRYKTQGGTYVWATLASRGAAIKAGEPVLDLIDCRRRFVDVALPERRAEAIKPGDAAKVRLIGSESWQVGRVIRVSGAAAQRDARLYAAANRMEPGARDISVEVALPAPNEAAPARRCEVGRLAEVRFNWID